MPRNQPPAMEGSFPCSKCKEIKPFDQFSKNRTRYNGRASACRSCAVLITAEWQRNNPDKVFARNKRWKDAHPEHVILQRSLYSREKRHRMKRDQPELLIAKERARTCGNRGVTVDWYEARLSEQYGGCAICGRPDNYSRNNFSIDHDHSCCPAKAACMKCVRGLLCTLCNATLHKLEMTPGWIEKAKAYLEKYAKRE